MTLTGVAALLIFTQEYSLTSNIHFTQLLLPFCFTLCYNSCAINGDWAWGTTTADTRLQSAWKKKKKPPDFWPQRSKTQSKDDVSGNNLRLRLATLFMPESKKRKTADDFLAVPTKIHWDLHF